jgi:hypothetical protein
LLNKLKGKNKNNLARLHDIAAAKEGGRNVYYVFYEFIEGKTAVITNNTLTIKTIKVILLSWLKIMTPVFLILL